MELVGAIEAEVKKGHWPKVVAKRLGVHGATFASWMKHGEKAHVDDTGQTFKEDDYLYRQLYERIEEAEAFAEMDMLDQARTQAINGRTSWNGFLTALERRFPDRWRRRDPAFGDAGSSYEAAVRSFVLKQQAAEGEKPKLKAVE